MFWNKLSEKKIQKDIAKQKHLQLLAKRNNRKSKSMNPHNKRNLAYNNDTSDLTPGIDISLLESPFKNLHELPISIIEEFLIDEGIVEN